MKKVIKLYKKVDPHPTDLPTLYVLREEYNGFGFYQKKDMYKESFIPREFLIYNPIDNIKIVIPSIVFTCYEELYDIVDQYVMTGWFGIRAVKVVDYFRVDNCGDLVI